MNLDLDRFAHIDSPLRRWDARWKLAAGAAFVVATVCLRQLPTAAAGTGVALLLVFLGRLPWGAVCERLRPAAIVVIAIVLILATTGPAPRVLLLGLPLSRPGLTMAGLVSAKALGVLLALTALVSSAPAHRTWAAMRKMCVPAGLVQVLHLAYRYVFVIHAESRAVQTAMRARGFRAGLTGRSLSVLGNAVGMLLIRSTERAERVYLAMQARGFDGSFPTTEAWQTRLSDVLKFLALAGISMLLVVADFTWPRV